MTNEQTAADRIRKFIDEYKKVRGLHSEIVYEIHAGNDHRHAAITIADLEALLAQPEPEEATDEELTLTYAYAVAAAVDNKRGPFNKEDAEAAQLAGLRAVLARWGRPAIEPVPVSERPILKSSNFNDANGHCWCGTSASVDETGYLSVEMPPSWELREPCAQDDCVLPHHALPLPTAP